MENKKIQVWMLIVLLLCSCGKEPQTSSISNEVTSSISPSISISSTSSHKETINDFSGTEASRSFNKKGYEVLYKDINFKMCRYDRIGK